MKTASGVKFHRTVTHFSRELCYFYLNRNVEDYMTEAPKSLIDHILASFDDSQKAVKEALAESISTLQGEDLEAAKLMQAALEHSASEQKRFFQNLKIAGEHLTEEKFALILEQKLSHLDLSLSPKDQLAKSLENGLITKLEVNGKSIIRENPEAFQKAYDLLIKDESLPKEVRDKLADVAKTHVEDLKVRNERVAKGISELGWVERAKSGIKASPETIKVAWNESSTMGKVVKGAGAAVSVGAIIDGTRRMVSKDENGERHVGVGGLEVIAGGGGAYLSLFKKVGEAAVKQAASGGVHV